jgi:hypothetical protein
MRDLEFRRKNESTQKRKSGFENEKHLFFPNSSLEMVKA